MQPYAEPRQTLAAGTMYLMSDTVYDALLALPDLGKECGARRVRRRP